MRCPRLNLSGRFSVLRSRHNLCLKYWPIRSWLSGLNSGRSLTSVTQSPVTSQAIRPIPPAQAKVVQTASPASPALQVHVFFI